MMSIARRVLLLGFSLLAMGVSAGKIRQIPASVPDQQLTHYHQTQGERSAVDSEVIARRWGLSMSEAIRYAEVMQGPLGRWNPHIDPVLALGIYAESEAEKQHYAEQYAQQEYELTQRTLVFQQAYRRAFNRLYPDVPMLNPEWLQPYQTHQQKKQRQTFNDLLSVSRLQNGDRLLYFPSLSCEQCGKPVKQWLKVLQSISDTGIDIYVVNAEQVDQARQWAKRNAINPDWVNAGTVTLNLDKGLSASLAKRYPEQSTKLYLIRGTSVFALKPGEFGL